MYTVKITHCIARMGIVTKTFVTSPGVVYKNIVAKIIVNKNVHSTDECDWKFESQQDIVIKFKSFFTE